jgi:diaminopimelate epimerase
VLLGSCPSPELARRIGPIIEHHPDFPNRTNVQFLEVLDRENIRIEIWERGAGYTLASGSSSCAAAAAARHLGLVDDQVAVHMPGGVLEIDMREENIRMTGPAVRTFDALLAPALYSAAHARR